MELAGLEPATSWVRFGLASHSNDRDLQGFWSALAEISRSGYLPIAGDYREFAPQNGVSGAKALARSKPPLEVAAGHDLVALWRARAVRSRPADGETSGRDGAVVRPQKQEDSRADSGPSAQLDLVQRSV